VRCQFFVCYDGEEKHATRLRRCHPRDAQGSLLSHLQAIACAWVCMQGMLCSLRSGNAPASASFAFLKGRVRPNHVCPAPAATHAKFPCLKAKDSGTGRQPLERDNGLRRPSTSTAERSKTGGMPEYPSTSFQSVSRARCQSRSWCTMMDYISAQAMTLLPSHVLHDKKGYCLPTF